MVVNNERRFQRTAVIDGYRRAVFERRFKNITVTLDRAVHDKRTIVVHYYFRIRATSVSGVTPTTVTAVKNSGNNKRSISANGNRFSTCQSNA